MWPHRSFSMFLSKFLFFEKTELNEKWTKYIYLRFCFAHLIILSDVIHDTFFYAFAIWESIPLSMMIFSLTQQVQGFNFSPCCSDVDVYSRTLWHHCCLRLQETTTQTNLSSQMITQVGVNRPFCFSCAVGDYWQSQGFWLSFTLL